MRFQGTLHNCSPGLLGALVASVLVGYRIEALNQLFNELVDKIQCGIMFCNHSHHIKGLDKCYIFKQDS